jgi:GDP-4-dehydro-6-deoxy-D-mannose reductase
MGTSEAPVPGVTLYPVDLRDPLAARALLEEVRPAQIYHLAAQAFVPRSFDDPWDTLENNIRAQLNLILGCLALAPPPRLLIVSSAEIYGDCRADELPLREDAPLRPANPYSVSKVAQDMLGLQYFRSHHLPILRARPFNHFGPGQRDGFVAPAFAMQIARIETGQQAAIIRVGELSPQRDFTDVRDIVRAYRLLMERGEPGEAYNVSAGEPRSIQSLLDTLLRYSSADIKVQIDPALVRPVNVPVVYGDSTRLRSVTGWQPTIPFEQTLLDILNDCRQRVQIST